MRSAAVVIGATLIGLVGLLTFRAHPFGGFIGNTPVLSAGSGSQVFQNGTPTADGSDGSVQAAPTRGDQAAPLRANTIPQGDDATGAPLPRNCRVVLNGREFLLGSRDGKTVVITVPGNGGTVTLHCRKPGTAGATSQPSAGAAGGQAGNGQAGGQATGGQATGGQAGNGQAGSGNAGNGQPGTGDSGNGGAGNGAAGNAGNGTGGPAGTADGGQDGGSQNTG
jgi:hypothetical protein